MDDEDFLVAETTLYNFDFLLWTLGVISDGEKTGPLDMPVNGYRAVDALLALSNEAKDARGQ